MEIRPLLPTDWQQVKTIYELGIATGIATFETGAPSWENWDLGHLSFGRFVAVSGTTIGGWVALSSVTDRCVYNGVAEVSVYVHPEHKGKGIGKLLMQTMIKDSEANGIWTITAGIFPENIPSIALHQKVGFRIIGTRERIAKQKGVWKDNVLLERRSQIVGLD